MDWLKTHARVLLWGTAAALVAMALFGRRFDVGLPVAAPVEPVVRAQPAAPEAAPAVTNLDLHRLATRGGAAPAGDLFGARDWRPPPPKPVAHASPPQEEPPLPPLPYAYLGRWVEPKGAVVMLGRDGRTWVARVGEVLEATWRVDAIEPSQVSFTYLPRNALQTLTITARPDAAAPRVVTAPGRADATGADAVLQVAMPDVASVGEDVMVLLRIDPRKAALVENASVEVRYDPKVLNAVQRGSVRAADPGRVSTDLAGGYVGHGGASSVVRLRVIAASATPTQLAFAGVRAGDGEGHDLAVNIDGPNPRALTITGSRP